MAKLGLIDPPEEQEPEQDSQSQAELDLSPQALARAKAAKEGRKLRGKVPAAPRVPAPLKSAGPRIDRFDPVAGGIIGSPAVMVEDVEGFDVDRTPTWFYKLILLVSILGYGGAFLFWNSTSPIIGAGWKLWAFVLMAFFAVIALVVAFRLGRKEEYGKRGAAFARRRRDGMAKMVREAAHGVASASKGLAKGGTSFGEGFQGKGKPNFIVRFVQWAIRTIVRIVMGFVSLVKTVLALVLSIWTLAGRIGWWLFRGIVEPVLRLALRIVRWALKITYRIARWALGVSWGLVYWILRRFPFKYITRMLEDPVRFHLQPRVLTTNVVVSELLGAPVKEPVRMAAEPHVATFRLDRQTRRAVKLLEAERTYYEERPLWLSIPTPEERRERAEERKRIKAEHEARAKQAVLDAKAAHKEAQKRHKEELKAAKAEGREDEVKAKIAAEQEEAKRRVRELQNAAKGKQPKSDKDEKRAAKEARKAEKAAEKAAKAQAKADKEKDAPKSKADKKREKEKAKAEKKAAEKQAKADKKKEKKAGEKKEKPAKKDKKEKKEKKANKGGDESRATPDDATAS